MVLWLQWREALWIKDDYLMWLERPLQKMMMDKRGDDSEEDTIDEARCGMAPNTAASSINKVMHTYCIADMPAFQIVTMEHLATRFSAVNFNEVLMVFLQHVLLHVHICPSTEMQFDVYKQVHIYTHHNCYIGNKANTCHIWAIPCVPAIGCKQPTPAHFDTALICN